MINTNSYLITHVLGPIGGTADYDAGWEKYKNINSNDKLEIKKIFIEDIKPYFDSKGDIYKHELKNTLSYYLTTNSIDFENEFESCLIAFDPPSDPKLFFIWLWEVLFPNESYEVKDIKNYTEKYNTNPPK